jgi:hypothetical protein
LQVKRGDTLDFLVAAVTETGNEAFSWAPVIELAETGTNKDAGPGKTQKWDAAADFSGPVRSPPTAWEKYAHVLLMSNEFIFID